MKQKIVIKVAMTCDKCRSKAMALVAETCGVDSVSLAGEAKDEVVVVGNDVDSVKLTCALRKKVGRAQLVGVSDPDKEKKKEPAVPEWSWPYHYRPYPQPTCVFYDQGADNACTIL